MAVSAAWLKHERHSPKGEASCKAKSHVTNMQYPEGVVHVQTCPVNAYPSTSRRQTPLVFTCPQGSAVNRGTLKFKSLSLNWKNWLSICCYTRECECHNIATLKTMQR